MTEPLHILAVTTSRADYSRLEPVLSALRSVPGLELELAVAGYHWTGGGSSLGDVEAGRWQIRRIVPPPDPSPWLMAGSMLTSMADSLSRCRPDYLLVLGDRHEVLGCALSALYHRVQVVHLGGGYTTRGAMDDAVRHAITQLATWHLVANDACARRVVCRGANPDRVRVVGAPDLDLVRCHRRLSRAELLTPLGLDPAKPFLLVTLHPETVEPPAAEHVMGTFRALAADERQVLVTAPADEPGAELIRQEIQQLTANRSDAVYHHTLGTTRYLTAMQEAAAMVGNSSSGILEASLLPLPVANVGNRQSGREAGPLVRHCGWGEAPLRAVLAKLDLPARRTPMVSPYGDAHAAEAVAAFFRELVVDVTLEATAS